MKVGIGYHSITPDIGMPTELFQNLAVTRIVTPILIKVCILEGKGGSAAVVSGDVMDFFTDSVSDIRGVVSRETGIPRKNIFTNSSHSHSSTYIYPGAQRYLEKYGTAFLSLRYYEDLLGAVRSAAADAVRDKEEVSLKHSRAYVSGVASSRRPVLADGTIGIRWGRGVPEDLCALPDGLIDPYAECVWFLNRSGKLKGLLFNYACHGTSYGELSEICWDYMGFAREKIEKEMGIQSLYLQGCAGNISPGKYTVHTPMEDAALLGGRLADAVIKSYPDAAEVKGDSFRVANETVLLKGRTTFSKDELKQKMEEEISKAKAEHEKGSGEPAGAMVISYLERLLMIEKHPDLEIPNEVGKISIGELSLFFLPSESFIQYALELKKHRGGKPTLVMAYTDCTMQYIPNKAAFEETGGYETDPDWSYSAKGNGEKVVETALKLADS